MIIVNRNLSKVLLQVSVREIRNNIVRATKYGGLKETGDAENNIIIGDYTLYSLLPPQLKKSSRYKVMCGCECCVFAKIINSSLLSWRDSYFKNSRI